MARQREGTGVPGVFGNTLVGKALYYISKGLNAEEAAQALKRSSPGSRASARLQAVEEAGERREAAIRLSRVRSTYTINPKYIPIDKSQEANFRYLVRGEFIDQDTGRRYTRYLEIESQEQLTRQQLYLEAYRRCEELQAGFKEYFGEQGPTRPFCVGHELLSITRKG